MPTIQRSRHNSSAKPTDNSRRSRALIIILILLFLGILARLYYWQIVRGAELSAEADQQYQRTRNISGKRGNIYFSDGQLLVNNTQVFELIAQPHLLEDSPQAVSAVLNELVKDDQHVRVAFSADNQELDSAKLSNHILSRIDLPDRRWVSVLPRVSEATLEKIKAEDIAGITWQQFHIREYPEASMAAHLTGFVGKNDEGFDVGYFGVEGALEQELRGKRMSTTVLADAFGRQLSAEQAIQEMSTQGRDVTLTIRRDLQFLIEQALADGIKKYQAKSGEIVIMDPKTGDILALAAWPHFDQSQYTQFDQSSFINPSLTALYEPGSTFKILTVAAGIDAGVISPNTQCPSCHAARRIGRYTIRTWNDTYNPNITMTDALAKSDNTAMIYIAEKLGADLLRDYIQKFGIGSRIAIDLQGDRDTPLPSRWGPVELATISFGQGISTTSLQLIKAVAAIANDGYLMRPRVVQGVRDPVSDQYTETQPIVETQVISAESANTVTEMLIVAAQQGEAQWIQSPTHTVAGKTGTSQIAMEGGYDSSKTIASYIGYAPPDDPKFVMLVKFVEPGSSPWAAETAAPLWYDVAQDLFIALNIPPDRQ